MPDTNLPVTPVANAPTWNEDAVYAMLADPVRRRVLLAVARNGGQPASVLMGSAGRRLDATLKHLTALRTAGLLVTTPDRTDGRRLLYALAPTVPFAKTETGAVLDFGFLLVRL